MKEKTVMNMTNSTPGTIIENTWAFITIKLRVGMNRVIMIGRLDAALAGLNQVLPLVGKSPPFVPNRLSVAGHDGGKNRRKSEHCRIKFTKVILTR